MPRRFDFDANRWIDDTFLAVVGPKAPETPELPAPATEPAPGRWHRPAKPTPDARRMLMIGLGPLGFSLLAYAVLRERCWPIISVLLVLSAAADARWSLRTRISPADLRLLENLDDPDVCLTDIRVVADGRLVGEDRGVAWFEEGRLLFNGHRTSFALGGEDVRPRSEWGEYPLESPLPDEALPLRTPEARRYVAFVPLGHPGAVATDQRTRFHYRFSRFRRLPPPSKGPRQWPPLEP